MLRSEYILDVSVKPMKNIKYLKHLFLLCLAMPLLACSYGRNFVIVNASESVVEIRYIFKKSPYYPSPMDSPPMIPGVNKISELAMSIAWRKLLPSQYVFDSNNRSLVVSLMPSDALRIWRQKLGSPDDAPETSSFLIEEIEIKGIQGEIKLSGSELINAFKADSDGLYTLTYK